ncbi:MAG: 4-vinyl reductase [bacterium]|nr:4-vinyl reductase [bacterium]
MSITPLPFRERLDWRAVPGQVVDGAVRYMLIRPDALMGAIMRLSPGAQVEMLAALHASVLDFGGRSAGTYNKTATRPLIEVVGETAPDLGWGCWTVVRRDGAFHIMVKDSPFAAPVTDAAHPVCTAMTGMMSAVGAIMTGAPVTAVETHCAAQHGGNICHFEIPMEHSA